MYKRVLISLGVALATLLPATPAFADSTGCVGAQDRTVTCSWSPVAHTGQYIVRIGEIETGVDGTSYTFDGSWMENCGCGYNIELIYRDGGVPYTGADHSLVGSLNGGAITFPAAASSSGVLDVNSAGSVFSQITDMVSSNLLPILILLGAVLGLALIIRLQRRFSQSVKF